MAESSLVPERQLAFSPQLAATIGLHEAILLQHLCQVFEQQRPQQRGGYDWYRVERAFLERTLPFWGREELQQITRSLVDKGVLLVDSQAAGAAPTLVFALNERSRAEHATTASRQDPPAPRRGAGLLPVHWAPGEDLLQLLSLNHNIPRGFALDQLEDFVFYWRERGEVSHAWENKFRQHVLGQWRHRQQRAAEEFRPPEPAALDRYWRPSEDAMEIMARSGIERDFIEQAIPEFILYWRERGAPPKELNTKFIQHIRIQWARISASLEHAGEPRRIADDWRPSADVLDILRMSHIDAGFADSLLPEFIVYWKDSGQAHTSWNSKFLQHVKYHWAKRHQLDTERDNAGHTGPGGSGRTRDRSLSEDLTDTSWAG